MEKLKLYMLNLLSILFLVSCANTENDNSVAIYEQVFTGFNTEHVVILVMDGAMYKDTWGDPEYKHIPKIASEIAPNGSVLTSFKNSGYTLTTAGHTALICGVNQNINNSGKEFPANPSIFHYLRKDQGLAKNDVWVVSGKGKLNVLSQTKQSGWAEFDPAKNAGVGGRDTGYRSDVKTTSIAIEKLTTHYPKAMIINLFEVDGDGHANNHPAYLNSIKRADELSVKLWNAIQNDSVLADKTTLIITNDHGRHLHDFQNHGDGCQGCRQIMFFGIGPDFKSGFVTDTSYDQRDVAATAAFLLGVDMPTSDGNVISEIFK